MAGISDGDTITVLRNGVDERSRLNGIDYPENRQAFGKQAKQCTSELVFGKSVMMVKHGGDRYGRTIGDAILPEANVYPSLSLPAVVSGVVGVAFQVGIGPLIFRHALVLICDEVLLRAPENIDRPSAIDTGWVFRHQLFPYTVDSVEGGQCREVVLQCLDVGVKVIHRSGFDLTKVVICHEG